MAISFINSAQTAVTTGIVTHVGTAPASITAGDLLVCFLALGSTPGATPSASGWILQESTTGSNNHSYIFTKIAVAGDVGIASWTWNWASGGSPSTSHILHFGAPNFQNSVRVKAYSQTTGVSGGVTSLTLPAPPYKEQAQSQHVLHVVGFQQRTNSAFTLPSETTNIVLGNSGGQYSGAGYEIRDLASYGFIGARQATAMQNTVSNRAIGVVIYDDTDYGAEENADAGNAQNERGDISGTGSTVPARRTFVSEATTVTSSTPVLTLAAAASPWQQPGHVLLAFVVAPAATAMSSAPSGWTLLGANVNSGQSSWVYGKVAVAADHVPGNTYTWTWVTQSVATIQILNYSPHAYQQASLPMPTAVCSHVATPINQSGGTTLVLAAPSWINTSQSTIGTRLCFYMRSAAVSLTLEAGLTTRGSTTNTSHIMAVGEDQIFFTTRGAAGTRTATFGSGTSGSAGFDVMLFDGELLDQEIATLTPIGAMPDTGVEQTLWYINEGVAPNNFPTITFDDSSSTLGSTDPIGVLGEDADDLDVALIHVSAFYPTLGIYEVVYDGSAFGPDYQGPANTIAPSGDGQRIEFLRDGGWKDTQVVVHVIVTDLDGAVTSDSETYDLTAIADTPTITFSPSNLAPINSDVPIGVLGEDDSGSVSSLRVEAYYPTLRLFEVVYDGHAFGPKYSNGSCYVGPSGDGTQVIFIRDGGWPDSSVVVYAHATDADGNLGEDDQTWQTGRIESVSTTTVTETEEREIMRDFKVDDDNDWVIEGGDLAKVSDLAAIAQDVKLALGFFLGEWFLDEELGVPYFQRILVKNPNLIEVREWIRMTIMARPGVKDVTAIDITFTAPRSVLVSYSADTDFGELVVSALEVP